jgi:hypothetical protein
MPSFAPSASRPARIFAALAAATTAGWLVSRVWVGLDFTDEMQYYGEITSLVQTGRFFQVDLFVQQFGYLFFLPLFKLHAWIFPDQSFLVVFGRLIMLAGYAGAGTLFWRAATRLGGFSPAHKLTGLAALLAWVPLQVLAPSYNSTSYLLAVALVAGWLGREPGRINRYLWITAAGLTGLTYTHPTAGLTLLTLAVAEAAWQLGGRAGGKLLLATAGLGLLTGGVVLTLNGWEFFADLATALRFLRAHGAGAVILQPEQTAGLLVLLGSSVLFARRRHFSGSRFNPLGPVHPPLVRGVALGVVTVLLAGLLVLVAGWQTGYFAVSAVLGLLLLVAVSPADDNTRLRGARAAVLVAGAAAVLGLTLGSRDCGTGYFAATVYMMLLVVLAAGRTQDNPGALTRLMVAGTATGAVFSVSSANGLHNFGVGAAAVVPFLVLFGARHAEVTLGRSRPALAPALLPALVLLLLLHGVLHPYMEPPIWGGYRPVRGVPAFRGLWISPTKAEAVDRFRPLAAAAELPGRRLLVIGSQPWFYFACAARPATPMFFMHYAASGQDDAILAERLFRGGPPDAILLTDPVMPPAVAARVMAWMKPGVVARQISLPPEFIRRFQGQTGYIVAETVHLLTRPAAGEKTSLAAPPR